MKPASGTRLLAFLSLVIAPQSLLPGMVFVDGAVSANSSSTVVDVDVVVVGGGFSGLMSAHALQQAGLKTVLLEAKDALGGRSRSQPRRSGRGIIEMGATWINNTTQPAVYALTQQFGLETAEQYTDGDSVFQGVDGKVWRMHPDAQASTDDPAAAELEGQLMALILEAAEQRDIRKWHDFPVDQDVSVAEWVAQRGLWENSHVRGMCSALTTSIVGREPDEIGAHYFFDYIKSGHGLMSLISEGALGAQSLKIKQGTTAIATSLADAMAPGSVLTNTPVYSIAQCNDDDAVLVTVGTTGQSFRAKKVIIAIPTNTYADITFSPPLPRRKNALVSRTKPGIYAKMILSYAEPWWRAAGLVGKFSSLVGPVCFSWDTSDPALSQYSLAVFVAGDIAERWHALPELEKEGAIIEHLAALVGNENGLADRARDVLEVNYVEWTTEEHIGGAPTSSMGPGMLRRYGTALREPFGNLHFGGGETAYEWKGYLEGAITAGQRAAQEVVEALGGAGGK